MLTIKATTVHENAAPKTRRGARVEGGDYRVSAVAFAAACCFRRRIQPGRRKAHEREACRLRNGLIPPPPPSGEYVDPVVQEVTIGIKGNRDVAAVRNVIVQLRIWPH